MDLPSGDRPAPPDPAAKFGVQGGVFESWFRLPVEGLEPVFPNTDDMRALMRGPGIGEAIGGAILAERENGPFRSREDFYARVIADRYEQYWDEMKAALRFDRERS